MTYELILGDRAYSSWSLRAWLLMDRFGIAHRVRFVDFSREASVAEQLDLPPAATVPVLLTPEGVAVHESLAIAEELATRHPDLSLWPRDAALRARARTLAAEMHSGFRALREACPMNLHAAYEGVRHSDAVRADIARIDAIWSDALARSGGPWLAGDYSIADAFYAPVAARIASYGGSLSDISAAYVAGHLADPGFRRWRAMALAGGLDLPRYARDDPQIPWPGPAPLAAAVADGPSLNDVCPYSGKPVTHFLSLDDEVWGFCNSFCRDKTFADPEVWPAFVAMRAGRSMIDR